MKNNKDVDSLSHTTWRCQYHVVFAPKYRRMVIYGYKSRRVNSSYGSMDIDVPQDRKSTFEPQIVKKRQKDISDIDQKIISMYAKGMTTRQISETIEDIYGFETSEGFISDVTDKILPQIEDWQNRPLDEVYPILYMMRRTFLTSALDMPEIMLYIYSKSWKLQFSASSSTIIIEDYYLQTFLHSLSGFPSCWSPSVYSR